MTAGREGQALRVFVGPVQGFIASGRRTRDYWAGSFLLSRLAGEAMAGVIGKHGTITIPAVHGAGGGITEPTLAAIMAQKRGASRAEDGMYVFDGGVPSGPLVGTLVNHFRANVPADFTNADMETIAKQVRGRFKALADEIKRVFINPALNNAGLDEEKKQEINARWDAQVNGDFFEILWVLGPDEDTDEGWQAESRWLERRKAMRTHLPIVDPGLGADPCPVHAELKELGGFARIDKRQQQDGFWEAAREIIGREMYPEWEGEERQFRNTLELREGERLSGFALVKRLFPLLRPEAIAAAIGWMPYHIENISDTKPDWDLRDARNALRNWPSSAFVAAIPWIVKVGSHAPDLAREYADGQYGTLGATPIWEAERPQHHRVAGIDDLDKETDRRGRQVLPRFAVLDGTLHFPRGLEKHRFVRQAQLRRDPHEREKAQSLAGELASRFRDFRKALRKRDFEAGPASPFYAMLEMDGDGMGEVFSTKKSRAERGSKALLKFAEGVPDIVRSHDGILIYAGADDVNAMLPVETASPCARALNAHWSETMQWEFFDPADPCTTPTLSGSIVFADYQNALDDVRKLTHRRLEKVAKDGMGRNALALAVMTSGGVVSEWASCWQAPDGDYPLDALFGFAQAAARSKSVASRLAYVARERFSEILDARSNGGDLFDDDDLVKLFAKEMSDSGLRGLGTSDEAKARAIVGLIRTWYRLPVNGSILGAPRHVGGLLIARFLAGACLWPYLEARRQREGRAGQ